MSGNFADSPIPLDDSGNPLPSQRQAVMAACLVSQPEIQSFLLRILRSPHLADDALQRTFLSALQASESVRLPTIRGWLFQIALNEARKIIRESRLVRSLDSPAPQNSDAPHIDPASVSLPPDHVAILDETRKVVQACLSALPPEQQEVIRQRVYLGRTFSEIATNLQLPLGTVLTWCRRGILRLKEDPRLRDLLKD